MNRAVIAGTSFVCLDGLFLFLNKDRFGKLISDVQGSAVQLNYLSTALQYVIATICYTNFIKKDDPIWKAGLLGFCVHGIYDTTNYAVFKKYNLGTALLDTLWGATLYGSVHAISKAKMLQ